MKKEIIVGVLLAALIAATIVNNRYIKNLTDDVSELAESSLEAARDGDWDTARRLSLEACQMWSRHQSRTQFVLRQNIIEAAETALNAHYGYISARSLAEAEGSGRTVTSMLKGTSDAERVRLGSIF